MQKSLQISTLKVTISRFFFSGQRVKVENFSEAFYKPDGLYEAGMLDHIFRGMIKTHTQSEDLHVNEEMTNKMFMDANFGFGLDLVAQVIQQGRVLQPSTSKSQKMALNDPKCPNS